MSVEHWDDDLPARVREAALFILELVKRAPAGTVLGDDARLWLREFEDWKKAYPAKGDNG